MVELKGGSSGGGNSHILAFDILHTSVPFQEGDQDFAPTTPTE